MANESKQFNFALCPPGKVPLFVTELTFFLILLGLTEINAD